jgi:uroporphyrinogen-III synthase
VKEIVAYTTMLTPQAITSPADGILFFSPSGVESYLLKNSGKQLVAFCLGETTAAYARDNGFANIRVAEKHSASALVDCVINHCKRKIAHA